MEKSMELLLNNIRFNNNQGRLFCIFCIGLLMLLLKIFVILKNDNNINIDDIRSKYHNSSNPPPPNIEFQGSSITSPSPSIDLWSYVCLEEGFNDNAHDIYQSAWKLYTYTSSNNSIESTGNEPDTYTVSYLGKSREILFNYQLINKPIEQWFVDTTKSTKSTYIQNQNNRTLFFTSRLGSIAHCLTDLVFSIIYQNNNRYYDNYYFDSYVYGSFYPETKNRFKNVCNLTSSWCCHIMQKSEIIPSNDDDDDHIHNNPLNPTTTTTTSMSSSNSGHGISQQNQNIIINNNNNNDNDSDIYNQEKGGRMMCFDKLATAHIGERRFHPDPIQLQELRDRIIKNSNLTAEPWENDMPKTTVAATTTTTTEIPSLSLLNPEGENNNTSNTTTTSTMILPEETKQLHNNKEQQEQQRQSNNKNNNEIIKDVPILLYDRKGSKRRNYENSEKLVTYLETNYHANITLLGEEWNSFNPSQQAATYNQFQYIICPHGGHMSNLIYSRPNTKVIEIQCENDDTVRTKQIRSSNPKNQTTTTTTTTTKGTSTTKQNGSNYYNDDSLDGYTNMMDIRNNDIEWYGQPTIDEIRNTTSWFVSWTPYLNIEHFIFVELHRCPRVDGKRTISPKRFSLNEIKFGQYVQSRFNLIKREF